MSDKNLVQIMNEQIAFLKSNFKEGFEENEISDGYHTFNELYEFRKMYNAALFNEWASDFYNDVRNSFDKGHVITMQEFKIIATETQLDSVGIDYNLTGICGTLVKKYPTGYFQLQVVHYLGEFRVTNDFDIPANWLEPV